MKTRILLFLILSLFAIPSFAQKKGDKNSESRRKEMTEIKMKFLADEMELKDDQRKKFNELYMEMEKDRRAIFKKIKTAENNIAKNKNATEADYEKATKEINDARAEMSQIDKKYEDKFASFLSKKQLYKLKEAENKFMERLRNCRDKKKKQHK